MYFGRDTLHKHKTLSQHAIMQENYIIKLTCLVHDIFVHFSMERQILPMDKHYPVIKKHEVL